MAGEWIKIEEHLPDKPEIVGIAAMTGIDQDSVVGKLARVWIWASANCRSDGIVRVTILSRSQRDKTVLQNTTAETLMSHIDRVAGLSGFAESMVEVGWLAIRNGGLVFPKFEVHNSKSAKERALANQRQRKYRHDSVTEMSRSQRDKTVSREEKRREEKRTTPQPPSRGGGRKPAKSLPPVPDTLSASLEFVEAWGEWEAYRREIGKTLKPTTARAQLARLEAAGPVEGEAMLRQSIANGWMGIFPVGGDRARANGSPGEEDNRERNMRLLADIDNGGKP